jgi:hypothetical protein
MSNLIDAATRLQSIVGGVVLLVHHTGKDTSRGLRGHSSLLAALDTAVEVIGGLSRSWCVRKSKDGREEIGSGFRLEQVELGIDEDGAPISSCVVVPDDFSTLQTSKPLSEQAQLLVNAYISVAIQTVDAKSRGITQSAWQTAFYQISKPGKQETLRKRFDRARAALQKMDALEVDGDYHRVTLPNVIASIDRGGPTTRKALADANLATHFDGAGHETFGRNLQDMSQGPIGQTVTPP